VQPTSDAIPGDELQSQRGLQPSLSLANVQKIHPSRTALSAEILFLRKQLAFYEERQVQPRRSNDSARFSLILWSRSCNWKEALLIVKPETSAATSPEHPQTHRANGKRESDLGTSACGSGAVGEAGHLCFSTYSARQLASRTGGTRQREDVFAELEDVCPQSRPVHRRVAGVSTENSVLIEPVEFGWPSL
jgi:hypothetical protein